MVPVLVRGSGNTVSKNKGDQEVDDGTRVAKFGSGPPFPPRDTFRVGENGQ